MIVYLTLVKRKPWWSFSLEFLMAGLEGRRQQAPLSFWVNLKSGSRYQVGAAAAAAKSLQSCPTLCDPIDRSPPGSPVLGILQARTLEWVAISFSKA